MAVLNISSSLALPSSGSLDNFGEESEVFNDECENLYRIASTESLNTLLMNLPDIIIPEPLCSPLPLQCLALNALPDSIRKEIDGILEEYSSAGISNPAHLQSSGMNSSPVGLETDENGVSICEDLSSTGIIVRESGEDAAPETKENQVSLHTITLKRNLTDQLDDNSLGMGFQVIGGVNCNSCKKLHTVVTSVSANCAHSSVVRKGLSIKKWAGKDLEDCTFEEVRVFLKAFSKSGCDKVEMTFKECSGELISRPKSLGVGDNRYHIFGSWNRRRTHSRHGRMLDYLHLGTPTRSTDVSYQLGDQYLGNSHPSSTEILDTHSAPEVSPYSSSHSQSRSPTPDNLPRNGNETVEVSIPRLDSNARALSAVMEARPKSPHRIEEGMFSRFPNGMIQLSLKYDNELEDLQIVLHQVKGQSNKEIGDLSDVFINTYLLPDNRNQGVRSVHVAGSVNMEQSTMNDSYSYMITKKELETCVLRVLLWDGTRSKKIIFRGEVLLGLSDNDIVSLNGQPIWFTVCPLDPNIASLPKPVHYKQQRSLHSMEQILNKFKQKAVNLANLKTSNIKSSTSMSAGFPELSSDSSHKGITSVLKKDQKRIHKVKPGSQFFQILQSEMGDMSRHTINEAKLAKLNGILNVLRDTANEDDTDTAEPQTPEFISVFETKESDGKEHVHERKRRKKTKASKSMLDVLHEDTAISSDSGDNLNDDSEMVPYTPLNKQSLAWLEFQKQNPGYGKDYGRGTGRRQRPRSDSFQTIPRLRESLNAGKLNKVFNYTFDDQSLPNYLDQDSPDNVESSLDRKQRTSEHNKHPDHLTTKEEGQNHVTSKYNKHHDHVTSQEEKNHTCSEENVHYKVMDTKCQVGEDEIDSPSTHSATSNCYPVPVELSLHRINVMDVDKPKEEKPSALRTFSFDPRSSLVDWNRGLASDKFQYPEGSDDTSLRMKPRSKSLDDVDEIKSNDEVLIVRAPNNRMSFESKQNAHGCFTDKNTVPSTGKATDNEAISSLDYKVRSSAPVQTNDDHSDNRYLLHYNYKEEEDDNMMTWHHDHERNNKTLSLSKCRSLDSLADATDSSKPKSKNSWKNFYLREAQLTPGNHQLPSNHENGYVTVGDAKLQLQYNDLNPHQPVLLVKLVDILFQSSKNLSAEFLMKCQVLHSSTGVCIRKNKTVVNIKNPLPSAPLGLLQFQTDIINLSLEVYFFSLGILKSKKEIGHIKLDLNSINLNRDMSYCEWIPVIKDLATQ